MPQEHKPVQQTNVQGAQTQQEQSPAVEQGQVNPAAQYADAAEGLDLLGQRFQRAADRAVLRKKGAADTK